MRKWAEEARYYSSFAALSRLGHELAPVLGKDTVLLPGSGDFHHLSYLMIRNISDKAVHVVVFDNHPDNMFFPSGIHCGSWVYHVARLPHVSRIFVIGIASKDLSGANILQNRYSVMKKGKVIYYCMSGVPRLLSMLAGNAVIQHSSPALIEELLRRLVSLPQPVYLSIDKDVLSPEEISTTWDQGIMSTADLLRYVGILAPRVTAADIVGDISRHAYTSAAKRLVRRLDGAERWPANPRAEQLKHADINLKIICLLSGII